MRQLDRQIQRLLAPCVRTIDETGNFIGILADHQLYRRATTGIPDQVDNQIYTLARCEYYASRLRRKGFDRLAIDGDDGNLRFAEQQVHDARIGDVQQAQADTFAAGHVVVFLGLAVDGDEVAEATAVRPVVHRSEAVGIHLHLPIQAPVVDRKHQVLVDLRRLILLDDQYAGEAESELSPGAHMRVIPVGAGIRGRKTVLEILPRQDRRLG